ncbi:MAG: hypothetical protein AABY32_04310 [Nanoarchaeota archaeon]|mgnify:CR=1 FL=1
MEPLPKHIVRALPEYIIEYNRDDAYYYWSICQPDANWGEYTSGKERKLEDAVRKAQIYRDIWERRTLIMTGILPEKEY